MKKLLFILFAVVSTATMFAAEEVADPRNTGYLWNDGKDFYVDRTYLTPQECANLLKNTCPEAFCKYDTGQKLITAGWSTFGVGLFLTATSWIPRQFRHLYEYGNNFYNATVLATLVWFGAGCVATASSIPLLCVGYSRRNKVAGIYNYQCMQKEPDIRYALTAGQNGLGFAINF